MIVFWALPLKHLKCGLSVCVSKLKTISVCGDKNNVWATKAHRGLQFILAGDNPTATLVPAETPTNHFVWLHKNNTQPQADLRALLCVSGFW